LAITIPPQLTATCGREPDRVDWLARLPAAVDALQQRWRLEVGEPFHSSTCAWVAPARQADGHRVVLKIGMPHMEGGDEIAGLRFWNGDPTVCLLAADSDENAMLLEACEPGDSLRGLAERDQDVVIATLMRRLWRFPNASFAFRPLATQMAFWASETIAAMPRWSDVGLVEEGLRLFDELSRPSPTDVLLATDLHAGSVLRAQREPWLVIDPKPFIGDRAYDVTQHLLNCPARLCADPRGTIRRLADLVEIDDERLRLWMFARLVAGPRDTWDDDSAAWARLLA
jgi:streptomycin 6-kinase